MVRETVPALIRVCAMCRGTLTHMTYTQTSRQFLGAKEYYC